MSRRAPRASTGADPAEAVIARLERATAQAREAEAVIARLERATVAARAAEVALGERIREAHGVTKDLDRVMREWRAELPRAIHAQIKTYCDQLLEELASELNRSIYQTKDRIVRVFDKLLDELVGARVGGLPGLEALVDRLAGQSDAQAFAERFRASVAARAVTRRSPGGDGPDVVSGPGRCSNTNPRP